MSLAFNYRSFSRGGGALNVAPARGQAVPGILFEISPKQLNLIDQKEGHPNFYERREVTVLTEDGGSTSAITYVARKEKEVLAERIEK